METGALADWQLGTGAIIAASLLALWYVGRPLLRLLKIIGRFLGRIATAIRRFFQPIFEFLYRSFYILIHIGAAVLLGAVALAPFVFGEEMALVNHIEAGVSAVVILGLAWLIFRHFMKYPLRKGDAHMIGQAGEELDADALEEDFDLGIDV